MIAIRCPCLAASCLVVSALGCERSQPLAPVATVSAATSGTSRGPAAPSATAATAVSYNRIDVSWHDNSSNETGFEVHRSTTGASGAFGLLASRGAGITSYSDAGLTPSTQYCYKVRAFRTSGGKTAYSEFSGAACATTLPPPIPPAPSDASATPASSSAVVVSWIDRSTNEEGFRLERSLDAGSTWASARAIGPNVASSQDDGLASEQQVCYRVIAFNARGDSPPSNSDCTTPPAAPTGLTAAGADGPAVDLSWTDQSAVEDRYQLLRAADGVSFSALTELSANTTTYRDVGAGANTTYQYIVRATKDGGASDDSNIATAAAGSCLPTSLTEVCDNGIDDDCDGLTDSSDPDCPLSCAADACPPGYVCDRWNAFCVPHCGDGFQNGDEGDVDCGGSCAAKCAAGQHCWVSSDCASFSCVNDICQ